MYAIRSYYARSIIFSSRTRKSFTCIAWGISPISSRKIEPLCAASNLPFRSLMAPVKEPFLWPKSSLSRITSYNVCYTKLLRGQYHGVRLRTPWVIRIRVVAPPISREIIALGYRASCFSFTVRNPIQPATETITARTARTTDALSARNNFV